LFYSLLHAKKRNSVYDALRRLSIAHRNYDDDYDDDNNNNNNNNNIVRDHEIRTCMLIGIAISVERNVIEKCLEDSKI
jgi:hypothetical protein